MWHQIIEQKESRGRCSRIYALPQVRHIWGDQQQAVHAGGQELFVDLIFVGAAYRVGQCMKACFYTCTPELSSDVLLAAEPATCLGLGLSLLHSCAPFVCMYTLWDLEKRHTAQFSSQSPAHFSLDLASDLFLILGSMSISPANVYRDDRTAHNGLTRVLVPTLFALGLWCMRLLEIALLSPREGARRQCAGDVITCLQLLTMWVAALVLASTDADDGATNALTSDLAAVLMWLGAAWWVVKPAIRTLAELHGPGGLSLELLHVCPNTGFVLHRNNEFMFLMLGETVLQIIVSAEPGEVVPDGQDPLFNTSVATAAVGLSLAVCMMFSFRTMVGGQLQGYGRTNAGLGQQAAETDQLLEKIENNDPAPRPAQANSGPASDLPIPPQDEGPQRPAHRSSLAKRMIDTSALDAKYQEKAIRILLKMKLYNALVCTAPVPATCLHTLPHPTSVSC